MGRGFRLQCSHCKYQLTVYEGIGFRYPLVCKEILRETKRGRYGSDLRDAARAHPDAAIHHMRCLLRCNGCGRLELGQVVDVCIPIGEAPLCAEPFCAADSELTDAPYVMYHEIGEKYTVIKGLEHRCGGCKKSMHPVLSREYEHLICPECKAGLRITNAIMWD